MLAFWRGTVLFLVLHTFVLQRIPFLTDSITVFRMFAPSTTSEVDIMIEGPTIVTVGFRLFTAEFRILIKSIKLTFKLDEEFEFVTVDGRTVMVRI